MFAFTSNALNTQQNFFFLCSQINNNSFAFVVGQNTNYLFSGKSLQQIKN